MGHLNPGLMVECMRGLITMSLREGGGGGTPYSGQSGRLRLTGLPFSSAYSILKGRENRHCSI